MKKLRFEQLENKDMLSIVVGTTGNTTPPADDPGFYNVGIRGSGSAVYLGNEWVITAAHVGDGATLFNGTWYQEVPNSLVSIKNTDGSATDLIMYKISGYPNLASIPIDTNAPTVGENVIMIGSGRDRQPAMAFWDSSWNPTNPPATYTGYIWTGTQTPRWGSNTVSETGFMEYVNSNGETAFATTFSNAPNNAQGAPGDSGGAVFTETSSGWELAGIMFAISDITGEPWGISVFGQQTYSADLSVYSQQIDNILSVQNVTVQLQNNGNVLANQTIHLGNPNTIDYSVYHTDPNGNVTFTVPLSGTSIINITGYSPLYVNNATLGGTVTMLKPSGDVNHDGIINGQDIALIASEWGEMGWNLPGDVDGDGIVNGLELDLIASQWLSKSSQS